MNEKKGRMTIGNYQMSLISFQSEHVVHIGAVRPTAGGKLAVSNEQREVP